jgi:hypothetical protein
MGGITAVMLVRNEQNILPYSAAYLLYELQVDRLIIADNGSTDRTVTILRRLAATDERVRWTDASGVYLQSEIITGLARDAWRQGADWVLPNDADEFFWFRGKAFNTLSWPSQAGVLHLSMRNFIQGSWVAKDHPRSLETMIFSAEPVGTIVDAQALAESGTVAVSEVYWPHKLILRACEAMVVQKGNHTASAVEGDTVAVEDGAVLHAPLRGRDSLARRVDISSRLLPARSSGESWHLRRLPVIEAAGGLDAEWRANSTWCGRIGPAKNKRWLRLDLRLRRLALRHRHFARKLLEEGEAPNLAPRRS